MYRKWAYNETHGDYVATGDTAEHLPPGLYTLATNNYGDPVAKKLELKKDEITAFRHGPLPTVLEEVRQFWAAAAHYARFKVSHKRGILMHGPHGCGKTGIVSAVIADTVERNGLAFQVYEVDDFASGLAGLRQVEDGRPVLAVVEDMEKIVRRQEEDLLETMDGASAKLGEGVLFLCTTNNLEQIPPRIRCRPSRIDTLIEIGPPDIDLRQEYLRFVLAHTHQDDPRGADRFAREWAGPTQGLSLAALKEFVLGVEVYGKKAAVVIEALKLLTPPPETDDD